MSKPISDEELDHQRDVLQAMLDSGIPMDDGGIACALSVIARLDKAEAERDRLGTEVNRLTKGWHLERAELARYRAVVELVSEPGMFACQQPLPRIADEFGTLVEDSCGECWDCRLLAALVLASTEEDR